MSQFSRLAMAAGVLVAGAAAAHAQATTTRIEPRPVYGATMTIEEGVRVIRPLPPERRVIVNPGGATPLSLGFNETHVIERSHNFNHDDGVVADPGDRGFGIGGFVDGVRGRGDRRRAPGHHGGGRGKGRPGAFP